MHQSFIDYVEVSRKKKKPHLTLDASLKSAAPIIMQNRYDSIYEFSFLIVPSNLLSTIAFCTFLFLLMNMSPGSLRIYGTLSGSFASGHLADDGDSHIASSQRL